MFRQVTHFIPWEFPLLLIVPAFVMDLIMQRTGDVAAARPRALWSASAFFAVFIAVQWPFADFMHDARRAQLVLWRSATSTSRRRRDRRWPALNSSIASRRRACSGAAWRIAALISWFMAWLGMHAGRAMQKVRR